MMCDPMNKLFRSLLPALAVALVAALAATPATADDFAQHKARHVHAEQQEIVILTDSLACIANTIDEAALKACLTTKEQQLAAVRAQFKPHP